MTVSARWVGTLVVSGVIAVLASLLFHFYVPEKITARIPAGEQGNAEVIPTPACKEETSDCTPGLVTVKKGNSFGFPFESRTQIIQGTKGDVIATNDWVGLLKNIAVITTTLVLLRVAFGLVARGAHA